MAGRSSRPPERDPQQLAREVCLRLLDLRPHTRAELATALARRGVAAEAAQAVLDRFGEAGLVDDAAFAEAWVSSRQAGKGLARRALAHELRGRGVAGDVVDEAVGALDAETELVTARRLVSRRLAVMADLPADTRARRLAGMLARRGYSPELVAHVIREVLEGGPGTGTVLDGEVAPPGDDGVP